MLKRVAYFIGWVFFRCIYKIIWRVKVFGLSNIPAKSGAIVASNHISLSDPTLLGAVIQRPIFFMAKKELFRVPILGYVLHLVNAFPVDRNRADLYAFKQAYKLLSGGEIVLIFPQGGRRKESDWARVKKGIGLLSCWAQVPIVPAVIVNSNKLKYLKQIKVYFSEPFYPKKNFSHDDYELLTKKVVSVMRELEKKYA